VSDACTSAAVNPSPRCAHVDYSKLSDLALCIDYWGIDALPVGCHACADICEAMADFVLGEFVFVLQLDWGDDSLGPLRTRLEAKVVECPAAETSRAGYIHLKYVYVMLGQG
jgi:hypothetical protein